MGGFSKHFQALGLPEGFSMFESHPTLFFLSSILRSNFARLRHPLKISWAVTYRCNLKCSMCNIWKRPDADQELSVAEAERFFSRAGRFSWVGLTGGEPFLRHDLNELADMVVACTPTLSAIHVNTNGQLPERVLSFAEGFRSRNPAIKLILTVSVDGPPEIHDRIRGRVGSWEKAAGTFAALKSLNGVKAQVGFTLGPDNFGSYKATLESLRGVFPRLSGDDVNVNVFQTSGVYYDNREMETPSEEALRAEVEAILAFDPGGLSLNNHFRRTYLKLYKRYLSTGRAPLTCQAFSASCFMNPQGDLYPCIMYDRRFLNVRDLKGGFEEAWGSELGLRIRSECAGQKCPSCWTPCDAFSSIAGSLHKAVL